MTPKKLHPIRILTLDQQDLLFCQHWLMREWPNKLFTLYTLNEWLERYALDVIEDHEQRLSRWQRHALWLDLLPKKKHGFAKNLDRHHQYLRLHFYDQLEYFTEHTHQSHCQQLFSQFSEVMKKHEYLDHIDLYRRWLAIDKISEPDYFFTHHTKDHRVDEIIKKIGKNKLLRIDIKAKKPENLSFKDAIDELHAMMHWLKAHQKKHPDHIIHCIHPDLKTYQHQIAFIAKQYDLSYALLLPQKWADDPLIALALHLLSFRHDPTDLNALKPILESPHLPHERFRTTIKTLLQQQPKVNATTLQLPKHTTQKEQTWWQNLLLKPQESSWNAQTLLIHWEKELDTLGWPYLPKPSHKTQQTLQAFSSFLDDWASQSLMGEKIEANEVPNILEFLGQHTLSHPPHHAKIYFMGAEQPHAGIADALWISQAIQGAFKKTKPVYALLPQTMQPKESISEQKHFHNLLWYASDIKVSHAKIYDDIVSRPLLTKPTFEEEVSFKFRQLGLSFSPYPMQAPASLSDHPSYPSGLLQAQAQCGYQAFARYRLGLKEHTTRESWPIHARSLDALERGTLYHHVLEQLWKQWKDQKTLLSLNEQELSQHVMDTIKQSYLLLFKEKHLHHGLFQSELYRAHHHIQSWVQLEKKRPPFQVIAHEKEIDIDVQGMRFRCRIDRIDEGENGLILIDYKTGSATISSWFGDRPANLQLPLYTLAFKEKTLTGLAYALVHGKQSKLQGIGDKEDGLSPASASFDHQFDNMLAYWRQEVQKLCTAYQSLEIEPQPWRIESCRFCAYRPLCRYHHHEVEHPKVEHPEVNHA